MSEELAIQPINRGWIPPGTTRNPGGRPKSAKIISDELRKLLDKGNGKKIAAELIRLSTEAKESSVRVKASELILDRMEGKPLQAIQVSQTLDENTARRLVEIGAMLQHIIPSQVATIDAQIIATSEQANNVSNLTQSTAFSSEITSAEKASGKRKYVRSGKYAKANKGRKLVIGEEIAKHESGASIVARELTSAHTLTTQSTDPTDQSVTSATRTTADGGE